MSKSKSNYYAFHILGISIVIVWIVLLVHLYKITHQPVSTKLNINGSEDSWFELFFKNKKIGYINDVIIPTQNGYLVKNNIFVKASLMSYSESMSINVRAELDKNFYLKEFDFLFMSNKFKFHFTGIVKNSKLIISRKVGGKIIQQHIPFSNPAAFGVSWFPFINATKIHIGAEFYLPFLNFMNMSQCNIKVRVVSYEKIRIKKLQYKAYRLESNILENPLKIWITKKGRLLKAQVGKNFLILKSSRESALSSLESSDLSNLISIETDTKIYQPRKLNYLKVKIIEGTTSYRIIEIKKAKLPLNISYRLPYLRDDMKKYLMPEFNLESNNNLIITTAKRIIGKTKDPLKATKKIVAWVYENIKKVPTFSFPTALETLKNKVGDCNEHAVLVAALLRAIGIPSRICVGLLYNNGKFFYHAWNEVYLDNWIPVDATLNQVPVDAGHIPLFYGNINKHIQLARIVGNIKIRVLKFSYDQTY